MSNTVTTILEARLRGRDDGLVGQLNATEREAKNAKGAIDDLAASGNKLSAATGTAARSQQQLATASNQAGAAVAAEGRAHDGALAAMNRRRAALGLAAVTTADLAAKTGASTAALNAERVATDAATAAKARMTAGNAAAATGIVNTGTAAVGAAASVSRFAAILSGGVAFGASFAASAVAGLIVKLFEGADAARTAELASSGLGEAQNVLGQIFDLTTGKIKAQNEMLLLNARIMANNLRVEALQAKEKGKDAMADAMGSPYMGYLGAFHDIFSPTAARAKRDERVRIADIARRVDAGVLDGAAAAKEARGIDWARAGMSETDFLTGLSDAASGRAKARLADLIDSSLDTGKLASEFRTAGPKGRTSSNSGTAAARALAKFGDSAEEKIQRIADGYNPAPRGLDKAFADLRTLDGLIADLGKRKPPSFEKLIGEAQAAKSAVMEGLGAPLDAIQQRLVPLPDGVVKAQAAVKELDGIIAVLSERKPPNWQELVERAEQLRDVAADTVNGPLNDMLKASREQRAVQLLLLQGREREAEVLARLQQLQRTGLPIKAEQRREVERMVAAEERINDLLDKREDIISIYMASIGDLRGALEDLFSGGSAKDFAQSIGQSIRQMQGRMAVELLFGDSLRALEKKARGQSPLDREIADLAREVDGLESETERSSAALKLFTDALSAATADIHGARSGTSHALGDGSFVRVFGGAGSGAAAGADDEIVVTGSRPRPLGGAMMADQTEFLREWTRSVTTPITSKLDEIFGTSFFAKMEQPLAGAVSGFFTAGPAGGILGAVKELPNLPDTMKKKLGDAFEGAQTGTIVAGVSKALGLKMSTTGSQIGGAIGGATGIPGGDIVGSFLGGIVGGLFKKTKSGSATITGVDSNPVITGNNSKYRAAAGEAASSVQGVLQQVADALGGEVGSFNVSIGVRKGTYRVDPTGAGRTKNMQSYGDDAQAAVMAAAFDAIGDGGIKGLSGAVQRALRSSPDIDKAVKEALKVQEVERIVAGLGGTLESQFREFEAQAKERVRIATQYGFDVTRIEARNAEDRAKLVEQILSSRVGSLQQLLEDMKFGDLFEGTASERRDKLIAEIAVAKADAEKGDDGAADRLAELTRKLVETSRDAYGTAGDEYASDRSNAISTAEAIIAAENERIRQAQQATLDTSKAMQAQVALTNEQNDILSEIRALLRTGGVTAVSGGSGSRIEVGRNALL